MAGRTDYFIQSLSDSQYSMPDESVYTPANQHGINQSNYKIYKYFEKLNIYNAILIEHTKDLNGVSNYLKTERILLKVLKYLYKCTQFIISDYANYKIYVRLLEIISTRDNIATIYYNIMRIINKIPFHTIVALDDYDSINKKTQKMHTRINNMPPQQSNIVYRYWVRNLERVFNKFYQQYYS